MLLYAYLGLNAAFYAGILAFILLQPANRPASSPSHLQSMAARLERRETPFQNMTRHTPASLLEMALVGVLLLPMRLAVAVGAILCGFVAISLSLVGLSAGDLREKPVAGWRRALQCSVGFFGRILLAAMGFWDIQRRGRLAPLNEASVMVSNHLSLVEALVHYLTNQPCCVVSRKENLAIPLIGGIISGSQSIIVDRNCKNSRAATRTEIIRRARSPLPWPRLIVFPEGTCTNSGIIARFRPGAFEALVPVQPVVVSYDCGALDPCFVEGGPEIGPMLLLLLLRLRNTLRVDFLPVMRPADGEDGAAFAERVRVAMAAHLGVPASPHSFLDFISQVEGIRAGLPNNAGVFAIETMPMRAGASTSQRLARGKTLLSAFAAVAGKGRRDGVISGEQLADAVGLVPGEDGAADACRFCGVGELGLASCPEFVRSVWPYMDRVEADLEKHQPDARALAEAVCKTTPDCDVEKLMAATCGEEKALSAADVKATLQAGNRRSIAVLVQATLAYEDA